MDSMAIVSLASTQRHEDPRAVTLKAQSFPSQEFTENHDKALVPDTTQVSRGGDS